MQLDGNIEVYDIPRPKKCGQGGNKIANQDAYTPNKKQKIFHSCAADEVVYGGSKGGGKSCALVMECLAYCLENKGATAYLFRETYDDLEANLVQEWKQKVPKELYEYSESKHIASLRNGSRVLFRYISNDEDADGYQGSRFYRNR
ncbi:MAG: terminase large subunit domain-containing protein [Christensenellaceae bacterium]